MPIYTRAGDKGITALFGGKHVSKDAPQVHAYGNIDELQSFLAFAAAHKLSPEDKKLFAQIQSDLYDIMVVLSGGELTGARVATLQKNIQAFEAYIDETTSTLPELHNFILPQGGATTSILHVCRVVCRRAERHVVGFFSHNIELENTKRDLVIQYLNRLSDVLFTCARKYNKGNEIVV